MKYAVQFGFGFIILLMILSSVGVLYQIHTASSIVTELVEVNKAKIQYVNILRNTIRQRERAITFMLTTEDAFEKDDKFMQMFDLAGRYRETLGKLLALPMTEREQKIHKQLRERTVMSQPLTDRVMELIRDGTAKEKIFQTARDARAMRDAVFISLDTLVQLQDEYGLAALSKSRELTRETIWLISILGIMVMLVSVYIAIFVSRLVARKNRQLLHKNKALEKAYDGVEEAMHAKSSFMATMSHEIRTPITAIIGFAESTFFSNQNMEMRQKSVKNIIHSGKHLLQIINDILDLSKIESNKLEIETKPVSPFVVMREAEAILTAMAKDKGLAFGINYICPLPEVIISDPLRLKQIILNLCSNSIKFTDEGHVHVNVKHDESDNKLMIEIVDSGIGLTAEQIKKVFEPFKQADSSTSRRYGGTGLGLTLSRNMARALGGTLEVESEPGHGSCFRLSIDSGATESTRYIHSLEQIPENKHDNVPVMSTAKLQGRVLVVEDNEFNQELLTIYLDRLGIECEIAGHGRIAVEKMQEQEFDLVIMDIQMPVMDGIEATMRLRELEFSLPIVALTANVTEVDRQRCLDAGCNDFLTKPIDSQKFFSTISHYLNGAGSNPALPEKPTPLYSTRLQIDPAMEKVIDKVIREQLPVLLSEIEQSIAGTNWAEVKIKLNKLKSMGSDAGFMGFIDVAQKMEFQILNEDENELYFLFDELYTLYLRCAAGLEISPVERIVHAHHHKKTG